MNYFKMIFFAFFMISIYNCNDYKIIDLKVKKDKEFFEVPMYFEANDKCGKWTPALFYGKEPRKCQFGLGYLDDVSQYKGEYENSIKYLIASKEIKKNIFSFGKWDDTDETFLKSKLYIGDKHENFSKDNVATCKIDKNTGIYGCYFDNFTFLNETYPLKDKDKKPLIIYFSSETTLIHLPRSFEPLNEKAINKYFMHYVTKTTAGPYEPLILRNGDMEMTLEVDYFHRYCESTLEKQFHNFLGLESENIHYIVFPMSLFKNFHVQFDIESEEISFYTDNPSLLKITNKKDSKKLSKKEPEPTKEIVAQGSEQKKESYGTTLVKIIVIISVILLIIIIGLAYRHIPLRKKMKNSVIENNTKNSLFKFEETI